MKYAFSLGLLLLIACSSDASDKTPGTSTTTPTTLTIAPTTANVATCRTATFTATPGDNVTWAVDGSGTVANGVYTAPLSVPAPNTATVKATRGSLSATAAVTLATAFPGTPVDLARTNGQSVGDFVRPYAANGARVYALTGADKSFGLGKSTDGGMTWSAPIALATGDGYASAVAVDPANPDVVYVTVHRGDKGAGSTVELLVSKDGGTTFATGAPIYTGGNGDAARPDVTAPASNHVVITAPAPWQNGGNGEQGSVNLVFHSGDSGATWTGAAPFANGYEAATVTVAKESPRSNGMLIESGDGRYGPQLASNGAGKVCVTFADYDINAARGETHYVQCSTDSGATWGAAIAAVTGRPQDIARPQIAMSADGMLIAITYNKYADSSLDEIGQTAFKVSTDGGATFGPEKVQADVPDPGADGSKLAVKNSQVLIDSAGVIWLARQIGNGVRLQIDKSCDKGASLSGALDSTIAPPVYDPTLFQSSAGIFGGGIRLGAADSGPTAVLLLAP